MYVSQYGVCAPMYLPKCAPEVYIIIEKYIGSYLRTPDGIGWGVAVWLRVSLCVDLQGAVAYACTQAPSNLWLIMHEYYYNYAEGGPVSGSDHEFIPVS